jgi:hypothetical protein
MSLKRLVDMLEKKPNQRDAYAHLTDEQLSQRIIEVASELKSKGWLREEMPAQLEEAELHIA